MFMMIRAHLVLRLTTRFTKWRSDQADLICSIEGFTANTAFAMKALIKDMPYQILLMFALATSVVFGWSVRLLEL